MTHPFEENEWYQLVGVRSSDKLHFYVDGEHIGTQTSVTTEAIEVPEGGFIIGQDQDEVGGGFEAIHAMEGKVDQIHIHSRALSASEVTALYHQHSWKLNLTSHWTFDEGWGQTTTDVTGNGHDGTLGNSSGVDDSDPVWIEGISGKALKFDGEDDSVNVTHHSALNIGGSQAGFTAGAWIRSIGSASTWQQIVRKGSSSIRYEFKLTADRNGLRVICYDNDKNPSLDAAITADDGSWHHAAFTKNGSDNRLRLYFDGNLIGTSTSECAGTESCTDSLNIGSAGATIGEYFNGIIDDMRIYSRALTSDEITTLYQTTLSDNQSATLCIILPTDAPPGTYTIHANTTDAYANTTFEVVPPPQAIIVSIFPNTALLGEEVMFKGHGIYFQNISRNVWSSNLDGEIHNTTMANFSLFGLSRGFHSIYFIVQGEDGYWSEEAVGYLNVTTRPESHIDDGYPSPNPAINTHIIEFRGWGTDDNEVALCEWVSDINGTIYQGPDGNFSTDQLMSGHHNLTFRVLDNHGFWSDNVTTQLIVTGRPTAFIDLITPNPALSGTEVLFQGHGIDDGTIEQYSWFSSDDGAIYNGTSSSFGMNGLSNGTHTISFAVMDNDGFWSEVVSENLAVLRNNNTPIIHSVSIESSDAPHAYETSILSAVVNASDPDNDTLEYHYAWFVNNVLLWLDSDSINGTYFNKGDLVSLSVTVSDGLHNVSNDSLGLMIENLAPIVSTAKIIPDPAITTDNLSLEYSFSDMDGDSENGTIYRWYRNGIFSGITERVVSSEHTTVGESWKCQIIPSDGDDTGQSVETTLVTIMEISEVYGVEITAEKDEIYIEGKSEKILLVSVRNTGEREDNYNFSISGSSQGWTVNIESSETITLAPGEERSISFILADDPDNDSEGKKINVVITVISVTHEEVQDSVTINGTLVPDPDFIDLPPALIPPAIGIAGLVAFFRRRKSL